MKTLIAVVVLFLFGHHELASAEKPAKKIVIIKSDDVRGSTANWKRFFKLSAEKGVKVSAGIICDSLQNDKDNYHAWLKELHNAGRVEFWNHGWDHKKLDNKGNKTEFKGSGFADQKSHFEKSQSLMTEIFGKAPCAFGAPYNKMDADTIKVLNENVDSNLLFCYGNITGLAENKITAPMSLRGEHDGTGKPNFEKFKAEYDNKNVSFAAIQFHPNGFGEEQFDAYGKILDLLIADGWTFMLPREYVELMQSK